MADDLVTWLRAQIDERERAARKAGALCGCHPPAYRWLFDDTSTEGRILVADDPHPEQRRRIGRRWNGTYDGLFMAEHVVRHDPAWALRQVERDRRIIARHVPYQNGLKYLDADTRVPDMRCSVCHAIPEDEDYDHPPYAVPWPCPEILDAAAPYADRPGYRDEWRPE